MSKKEEFLKKLYELLNEYDASIHAYDKNGDGAKTIEICISDKIAFSSNTGLWASDLKGINKEI